MEIINKIILFCIILINTSGCSSAYIINFLKTNVTISLLIFPILLFAANENIIYNYGGFTVKSQTYIFGNNVRIRKSPSITAPAMDTLKIGTAVTIIEKSKQGYTRNGLKCNWYRISYNKDKTGYVWGGLLALGYAKKGNKYLLVGITEVKGGAKGECRLVENKLLIDSTPFRPHYFGISPDNTYGYTVSTKIHSNKGLKDLEGILEINCRYEACGYPWGSIWIGFTKKSVNYLITDKSVSEAGIFHHDEYLIFPKDKGGKKGLIILASESQEYDEKIKEYISTKKEKKEFFWDGKKLTQKSR